MTQTPTTYQRSPLSFSVDDLGGPRMWLWFAVLGAIGYAAGRWGPR